LPATTTGLPATIVVNVSAGATITPITITNGNCP
jgi:hypothetical protein